MKQVFQVIPAGSSNTAQTEGRTSVRSMKSKILALTFILLLVSTPTVYPALAEITLAVGESYQPGGLVEIRGKADPGASVTIIAKNRLEILMETEVTADIDGDYETSFQLADDAPLGIYNVIVQLGGTTVETSFRVSEIDPGEMYEYLLGLAEGAKSRVDEAVDGLGEEGVEVPEAAQESYGHGEDAIEQAESLYGEGQYMAAAQQAKRALTHFKFGLQKMTQVSEREAPEELAEARLRAQVRQGIERARKFLEQLRGTLARFEEKGLDTSGAEETLGDVESLLEEAVGLLEDGDTRGAKEKLEEAVRVMNGARNRVQAWTEEIKAQLAERYRENIAVRLTKMREAINTIRDRLPPMAATRVVSAIQATERRLMMFQDRITVSNVDEVIDHLEDCNEEMEGALEDINGGETTRMLKMMNRIHARMEGVNAKMLWFKEKGRNTTLTQSRLDLAREKLQSFLHRLEEGRDDEAEDLLDEIDDVLEGENQPEANIEDEEMVGEGEGIQEGDETSVEGNSGSSGIEGDNPSREEGGEDGSVEPSPDSGSGNKTNTSVTTTP